MKITNRERDKMYQFAKLSISLTKQGFNFTRHNRERYALTFDKISAKRLLHHETKTPFVNAFILISADKATTSFPLCAVWELKALHYQTIKM